MKRTRRNHGVAFKATVALAAVKGDKTLAELAEQFQVQPTPITDWKQQLQDRAMDVFGGTKPPSEAPDLKNLHAKIGQLTLECVFRPKPATHSDGTRPLFRAFSESVADIPRNKPAIRHGLLSEPSATQVLVQVDVKIIAAVYLK